MIRLEAEKGGIDFTRKYKSATHRAYADHLDVCERVGVDPEEFHYWATDFEKTPPELEGLREREPVRWPSSLMGFQGALRE